MTHRHQLERALNAENVAVFFLSTGRCGTQFFARKLAEHYDGRARVVHEPLHFEYAPPHRFSAYHGGVTLEPSPALQRHVDGIESVLARTHHIETGWPVYGVLPWLIDRLKGRLKVVHLHRHPLDVATSLAKLDVYGGTTWSRIMSIRPVHTGVVQRHLRGEPWSRMSVLEKCLFWWTEINAFALRLRETVSVPWLSLRFEDVFASRSSVATDSLTDFIGLPRSLAFRNSVDERVDDVRPSRLPPTDLEPHCAVPYAIEIAARLDHGLGIANN